MDPAHPNALQPRKRTYHTLVPGLALKAGKPWLVFGTMGAEGQPQTHVQVLNNIVLHGMDIQRAIAAPRWLSGRFFVGDDPGMLTLEDGMPAGTAEHLSRLGHHVRTTSRWDEVMGHCQAIRVDDAERVLEGGADPRGDGLALGF
jgi:gamma-glutamyltranspeptidase/glutathione hydrolase